MWKKEAGEKIYIPFTKSKTAQEGKLPVERLAKEGLSKNLPAQSIGHGNANKFTVSTESSKYELNL